ncbi:unnamed protein product, partial [Rotaria sp. Silwood1]
MREYLIRISPHFNKRSICTTHWIVVVNVSNSILKTAKRLPSWCIVIVVGEGQRIDQVRRNVFYLTAEIQDELAKRSAFFKVIRYWSKHHYAAQKNAGYYWAMLHKATAIWDFNHDNELIVNERTLRLLFHEQVDALTVPNHRNTLFNPYPFFLMSTQQIRPRGFPPRSINIALKFDSDLDFMWTNRMPMWYRWETYPSLRNYISSAWNLSSFDDAFIEFSKNQRYSQFTILSSYAARFEANYYRIIMNTDRRGAISVGSNRGRDKDIRIGCCRSFGSGCNDSSMPRANEDHLLRFDNT